MAFEDFGVGLPRFVLAAGECSSAGEFGLIAQLLQLGGYGVAVIALDLDGPVLDGPAGANRFFELFGQGLHIFRGQFQISDDRHRFAAPPLLLAADSGRLLIWR